VRTTHLLLAALFATACRGGGSPRPGDTVWARSLNAQPGTHAEIHAVAADASGNVYVAGRFQGTVNPGGGALRSAGTGGYSDGDMLVASFDRDGKFRWAHHYAYGDATSVAVAASGDVLVTGNAYNELSETPASEPGQSHGLVVARFDPSGRLLWNRRFEGGNHVLGTSIAATPDGGFVVAGTLAGSVDLGGGVLKKGCCDYDLFVASFDAAGRHRWSLSSGSDGHVGSHPRVAVDASGDAVVAARFGGKVDFAGIVADAPPEAPPMDRFDLHFGTPETAGLFLFRVGPAGRLAWSRRFGGAMDQDIDGLAALAGGRIGLLVSARGPLDLGGTTVPGKTRDLVVARFDAGNHVLGHERFAGRTWFIPPTQTGACLAPAAEGGLVFAGRAAGTITFGGPRLDGDDQVFVARLDAEGRHVFSRVLPSGVNAWIADAATDAAGRTVVGGQFSRSLDLGRVELRTGEPGWDGFVAVLAR